MVYVDEDGSLRKDGRLVNEKEQFIDQDGNVVNENGRLINEEGDLIDNDGNLVDEDGNILDNEGYPIDKDGNRLADAMVWVPNLVGYTEAEEDAAHDLLTPAPDLKLTVTRRESDGN